MLPPVSDGGRRSDQGSGSWNFLRLVTGDTDDDYIVLTDIQGLEDFFGDMDFKVGGTHKGITSIQMDIKIHGLTRPIIEELSPRRERRDLHPG